MLLGEKLARGIVHLRIVDHPDVLRVLLEHHADLGDDAWHAPKQGSKSTFYKVLSDQGFAAGVSDQSTDGAALPQRQIRLALEHQRRASNPHAMPTVVMTNENAASIAIEA